MTGWLILAVVALLIAWPLIAEARRAPMTAEIRRDAEGRFADLPSGRTHYDWIGPLRGPIAVCVHGLTTPSFVWRGLGRGLAALGFRVLIYDLYGRGYSDRPMRRRQDHGFFVRQLEELLADQQVDEDFTLLGYSMGGAIATAFAARHPGRIRRLVLIAAAGVATPKSSLMRFVTRTPVLGDWVMLAAYPAMHRRGAEAERGLPSSVENIVDRQQRELGFRGFVPAVLSSLRGTLSGTMEPEHRRLRAAHVPVLAIWGRDDGVIPISAVGRLADWNREARQEVIDGAGHGLPYTHTDDVLAVLKEALREVPH
jgi:pimeloyl-ACP methyl ester carboxylesterase